MLHENSNVVIFQSICISNDSWEHSKSEFDIRTYDLLQEIMHMIDFYIFRIWKNISYRTYFFYIKFESRMFLAFIWYAYCACKSKIWIFQKIVLLKTKKFLCKTNELQGSLTKKLQKKVSFSMILKANKDASFHIRPFLFDLYEIWQWIRMIKRNVPLWSPPTL